LKLNSSKGKGRDKDKEQPTAEDPHDINTEKYSNSNPKLNILKNVIEIN